MERWFPSYTVYQQDTILLPASDFKTAMASATAATNRCCSGCSILYSSQSNGIRNPRIRNPGIRNPCIRNPGIRNLHSPGPNIRSPGGRTRGSPSSTDDQIRSFQQLLYLYIAYGSHYLLYNICIKYHCVLYTLREKQYKSIAICTEPVAAVYPMPV